MLSFVGLCLLLGLGYVLRTRIGLFQKLYLPSCIIAGLIGLAIIQGVEARHAGLVEQGRADEIPAWLYADGEPLPEWTAGWGALPGRLINVVFACLFLGVPLPNLKTLWNRAGPQLAYGQTVAWGQYVVGLGLTLLFLAPVFGVPHMFGAIIPVGFEGGHGTASGLAETFEKLQWQAGRDFCLASATAGVSSAIIVGMILVNWAARRRYLAKEKTPGRLGKLDLAGIIPEDRRRSAGRLTVSSDAIGALTLHTVFVGVAILIGLFLKWLLGALAASFGSESLGTILGSFPLFPLCMLGGLAVQFCEQRFDRHKILDRGLALRTQNCALDFLVAAAIATINIKALIPAIWPFLILAIAAILWNVFCVVFLARRMLPDAWFERSIAEMGQSMGVTATGLLLLRVVDPDYETPAADAFAYKQLMHEPFMGGGLWTSAAVPLIAVHGGPLVFCIAAGATCAWLAIVFVPRILRRR